MKRNDMIKSGIYLIALDVICNGGKITIECVRVMSEEALKHDKLIRPR